MNFRRTSKLYLLAASLLSGSVLARAQSVQTWLMLNQGSQETLLVTDPAEQAKFQKTGWLTNGVGYLMLAATPETVAVHRMVRSDARGNDRVFATTAEQVAACTKTGYHEEGTLGFAGAAQLKPEMIPVYRYLKDTKHLWLIGAGAKSWVEKNGWKADGVGFWIWPTAAR